MTPAAIILGGVALVVLGRLGAASTRSGATGIWSDPPAWARRLFGSRPTGLRVDDVLVSTAGWLWLVAGIGLLVSGQRPDSTAFILVAGVLFVVLVVFGLAAFAIRFRRETGRR